MNVSDIAVFVTVDTLFPGATADESALRAALQSLSRDDALFTCARINPSLTLARHMAGVVGEAGLGNSMGCA